MDSIFDDFTKAQAEYSGPLLATTLSPISPPSNISRLRDFFQSSNAAQIQTDLRYKIVYNNKSAVRIGGEEGNAWVAVYAAYWQAVGHLLATEDALARGNDHEVKWIKVYDSWKDVTTSLIRGYTSAGFAAWTIPCLYTTARNLRSFAIKADQQSSAGKNEMSFGSALQDDIVAEVDKNQKLKDAVQLLNRIFQLCANDKAPLEDSKKWGIYYTTNLLLKTYFKLNSISLSKNLLRALHATSADLPPMESFPKSHIVTFKYYVGIISFLEEDYIKAEEHLTFAYRQCHKSARKNRELILTYLIPCHLLTTHTLPSSTLLAPFPRLRVLFAPLSQCIRRGDLAGFDAALAAGEDEFVRRRIYLTLERGRDIALRNLLRKVFVFGGYEPLKEGQTAPVRRTRVPLQEFSVAIGLGQSSKTSRLELMEDDEVECLLAGMIYKNLMKGYISREHKMVVLSKAGAFPGTGV